MTSTLSHSPAKKLIMKSESVLFSSCLPAVHLSASRLCSDAQGPDAARGAPRARPGAALRSAARLGSECWDSSDQSLAEKEARCHATGVLNVSCQRLLQRRLSWEPKLGSLRRRSCRSLARCRRRLPRKMALTAGRHLGRWRGPAASRATLLVLPLLGHSASCSAGMAAICPPLVPSRLLISWNCITKWRGL